jgi:hypothetical protein
MYKCINKYVGSKGAPKANLSLLLVLPLFFTHESSGFLESLYTHPLALDLPDGQEVTADRRPYLLFSLSLLTKHSRRDDPPDRTSYCRSHINWIIHPLKPRVCECNETYNAFIVQLKFGFTFQIHKLYRCEVRKQSVTCLTLSRHSTARRSIPHSWNTFT